MNRPRPSVGHQRKRLAKRQRQHVRPHGREAALHIRTHHVHEVALEIAPRLLKGAGLAPAKRVLDLLRAEDAAFSLDVFGGEALWGGADLPVTGPGITWHGLTPQDRLHRAYPAFGFAMHLQRRLEPFGVSLVESMYAGCIAIASPAGAYAEIVRHGENGFLVEGDPEQPDTQERAARLILDLSRKPEPLIRVRDQARRSPVAWLDVARSWIRYAEALVGGRMNELPDGTVCVECGGAEFGAPDGQHCVACGNYRPHVCPD